MLFWLMIIILVLPIYLTFKLEMKKSSDPTSPSLEEVLEKFWSNTKISEPANPFDEPDEPD